MAAGCWSRTRLIRTFSSRCFPSTRCLSHTQKILTAYHSWLDSYFLPIYHSIMSTNRSVDEIIRTAEQHYDQYQRLMQEATAARSSGRANSPTAVRMERTASSPTRAITFSSDAVRDLSQAHPPGHQRIRRLTNDGSDPGQPGAFTLFDRRVRNASMDDGASRADSDDVDDLALFPPTRATTMARPMPESYVTELLTSESFSDHAFSRHLASCNKAPATTITALGEVWNDGEEIGESKIVERFEAFDDDYTSAVYEVYEIG